MDEEDDEEQALAEEEMDDDSSTFTSSPSIPDENIDFSLVYTLHTFEATVEGQASVLKGDSLTLLDDSNSYWWLVKVLKTNEVGYIPAENIETPFERLARLNKHRNVEVTSLQQAAHYIEQTEAAASARAKRPKKNVTMSKGVACQAYIILIGDNDDDIEERYEEYDDDMIDEDSQSTVLASDDPGEDLPDNEDEDRDDIFLHGHHDVSHSPTPSNNADEEVQGLRVLTPTGHLSPENASTVSSTSSNDLAPTSMIPPASSNRTPIPSSQDSSKKNPFLKIFSRSKRQGNRKQGIASPASDPTVLSLDQPESQQAAKPKSSMPMDANGTVLRVYAGNINVNATYNSVLVSEATNAEQLLLHAMDRFHISQIENRIRNTDASSRSSLSHSSQTNNSGVEYYLTVKSLDGDELTLLPQDKPLSMYQSLTAHLTTPMPSLASLKEQVNKVEHGRIGSPLNHPHGRRSGLKFNEDSVRFYLHKRIRRMNEQEGQIYVKVSLFQDDPTTSSGSKKQQRASSVNKKPPLTRGGSSFSVRRTKSTNSSSPLSQKNEKPAQSQIDKLIAVSTLTTVTELLDIALEKFHLLQQAEHQSHPPPRYRITLVMDQQDAEKHLNPNSKLIEVLHNDTHAKSANEKRFVLRKIAPSSRTGRNNSNNMRSPAPNILLQPAPAKERTATASPLLTPIPIMNLDTEIEMVLRRLERALLTYNRKQGTASPVPRVQLDPDQPKLAVMRNVNQGIDVYLPHGILRSKPLAPHQTQYALLASDKQRESAWDLVTQRILSSSVPPSTPTSDPLAPAPGMVELVSDSDLKQMIVFATRHLEHVERQQVSNPYRNTKTTDLFPSKNAVETSLSSLDELERELQRIIASHMTTS
ncbi:hypothetical protein DM01DRAFT_1338754 [Hesseltinella vesiculosa]|uniref:SH3 domain-containing protein n=1 Tax=Hesseltinella vesiculosa TaxID=101127 RepID=A0A1X2G985_9FUNG|nr:hypothetical protein DM01DRAFT_1338754 [Hesseltinella vesiculosa]